MNVADPRDALTRVQRPGVHEAGRAVCGRRAGPKNGRLGAWEAARICTPMGPRGANRRSAGEASGPTAARVNRAAGNVPWRPSARRDEVPANDAEELGQYRLLGLDQLSLVYPQGGHSGTFGALTGQSASPIGSAGGPHAYRLGGGLPR
jgi:hypothetical protein